MFATESDRSVRTLITFAILTFFAAHVDAGSSASRHNAFLHENTFVVYDVETTGLSPSKDRIVELGAVKIENGVITDQKSWLINPKHRISAGAQNVHGIDYDMVKKQKTFKTQYPEIQDFFGDAILLAHNARFDRDFLYHEVLNAGFDLPANPVADTLKLFREWWPKAKSHSLGALAEDLKVSGGTFHRGLDDSVYAAEIFLKGMKKRKAPRSLDKFMRIGGIGEFKPVTE